MIRKKMLTVIIIGISAIVPNLLFSQDKSFVSFEVQPGAGCSIFIQWSALPQMDTLNFEVEKSRDKQNWKQMAQLAPKSSHRYYIVDNEPEEGYNYYRIRAVDKERRFLYSDIKWLQINKTIELFIWPNPVRETLHVKTPFLNGMMNIIDAEGKLILEIVITDLITEVPTITLGKGIYFLHIRHNNQVFIQKFVKE